jgi:hypothetical protein
MLGVVGYGLWSLVRGWYPYWEFFYPTPPLLFLHLTKLHVFLTKSFVIESKLHVFLTKSFILFLSQKSTRQEIKTLINHLSIFISIFFNFAKVFTTIKVRWFVGTLTLWNSSYFEGLLRKLKKKEFIKLLAQLRWGTGDSNMNQILGLKKVSDIPGSYPSSHPKCPHYSIILIPKGYLTDIF